MTKLQDFYFVPLNDIHIVSSLINNQPNMIPSHTKNVVIMFLTSLLNNSVFIHLLFIYVMLIIF